MRVLHLTRDFPPRSASGTSTAVGALVAAPRKGSTSTSALELSSDDAKRGVEPDR